MSAQAVELHTSAAGIEAAVLPYAFRHVDGRASVQARHFFRAGDLVGKRAQVSAELGRRWQAFVLCTSEFEAFHLAASQRPQPQHRIFFGHV